MQLACTIGHAQRVEMTRGSPTYATSMQALFTQLTLEMTDIENEIAIVRNRVEIGKNFLDLANEELLPEQVKYRAMMLHAIALVGEREWANLLRRRTLIRPYKNRTASHQAYAEKPEFLVQIAAWMESLPNAKPIRDSEGTPTDVNEKTEPAGGSGSVMCNGEKAGPTTDDTPAVDGKEGEEA
ncbi:hypothetical protein MIND_00829500 [Mycena indigotica]|uniref:Uncharacterized protein n=1 Tax=Mycena indigotica TaxID=2126181 RepID=A0A8H6SG75_9AGAR|nr:uncharacterized protein MIND_00829500 [Mycena indigotica]KAF7298819.1 hypothetical protein MIND_00829500 [Mycena indigotica]